MRIQIEVTDNESKAIKSLMKKTCIKTNKDLFDNALALFEWAVNEKISGRAIGSINDKEKTIREVILPALSRCGLGDSTSPG